MLLPINPKCEWNGIGLMVWMGIRKGENGWIVCGGDGDGCRVVEVGNDKAGVKGGV